ncbi:RNA recognition motif domain-containing protein [Ditylenchus destructor]|uniref:RNA recognition motif domain-containing protein n=1 Tax=Ditylenchus destructor TaxID=166010 RepID=A0AAD4N0K9_9BILA|nr:RNA recognition motif domain-containing protein [Ditylenchus destructor]
MEVDKIVNDIDAQHAETPSKCDNNQKANPVVPRKDAEIASGSKNKQAPPQPRGSAAATGSAAGTGHAADTGPAAATGRAADTGKKKDFSALSIAVMELILRRRCNAFVERTRLGHFQLRSFSRSSRSGGTDQSDREARTIMVANLSKDTTVDSLRKYFREKNMDVTDCRIARNKKTGISRQFGFVEFATVEEAEQASKEPLFVDCKEVSVIMYGNKEWLDKYRIFVGGLLKGGKETSRGTLHRYFSQFGDIFECHIVYNEDNLSKGLGFVTYKSQDSVDRALNAPPHRVDNQVVTVKQADSRRREFTLFIGKLSPKTTDESLRKHFSKYGRLIQSEVKIDRQTGQSRGFGYIGFESQEELDSALKDQPHVVDGVEVEINYRTTELDLVVDSLPRNISEESLKKLLWDLFSRYGQVRDCMFIKNSAGTTTAFVALSSKDEAELASKDRPFIDYKNVSVQMSGNKDLDDKYKIFVGGLLKRTSGATLHHHFSKFGDIFECHIVRNDDNLSRGFGYVTYKSQDSLDRALNSQPHSIDSQVVTVEHTPPRRRELTLHIGNLSPKTTDETLRKHFSKYGQLTQCNVKIDRQTGQSRGFGYVGFASQEELDRALHEQPHVVDGVEVEINYLTTELDLQVDSLLRNISEETLKKSLWDYFSRYGQVRNCTFIKNSARNTTAFVSLSSKDEVSCALADRPHRISGKLVDTHQKGIQFALIVQGLPKNTTDEDLYETFSKAGKLVHWQVMRDRKYKTNRPLGYGFVSFSTAEEVARAIDGQPHYINGTMVKIERRYDIYKEYER